MYVADLGAKMSIYLAWQAQITLLLTKKVGVHKKYSDFSDVFFKKSAIVMLKYLDINEHVIDLEPGKQLFYRPIYSFGQVELEIFKIYIETNLTNRFIWSFKLLA